jgi:DNA-binding NtrC family response regulator
LEEGMLRRIGGLKDFPLNVRVIAASNRDLKSECDADRFRVDLYYRLSVIQIDIPPLRDRGEDIILLANNFIKVFDSPRKLKTQRKLSAEAAKVFLNHNWMGNVRELKNAVERALILEDGAEITTKYLPRDLIANENNNLDHSNESQFLKDVNFYLPPEGIPLEVVEKGLIQQALKRTNGNVTRAGKLLHLSRDRMRYRLKKVKDQKDNNINGEKKKKKKEKKEI